MIPLSLYIHIPWCEKKCPYCDFNSHLAKASIDENEYIKTLITDLHNDIDQYKEQLSGRVINTIFIGGGTPSLFSAQSFANLLTQINSAIPFADDIEITLEANPGSSEVDKFTGFYNAGINRLSIGIQSFNADHLKSLGRVHNSAEALKAANYAIAAGFVNFNLDIMFGLPDQSIDQCLEDVRQAINLKPSHLSCYQLTIETNTLFHRHPPVTPDDEALWQMQTLLQTELANNDYHQYEVSAYAKKDRRCRHNLNYWQFGDYLGIGAGAHGKLTSADGQISRYWKIKHPATYIDKPNKVGASNAIDRDQLSFEFMLNALRLTNGFNLKLYTNTTGLDIDNIKSIIDHHITLGLIEIADEVLRPTNRGQHMIDTMLQDYLPNDD